MTRGVRRRRRRGRSRPAGRSPPIAPAGTPHPSNTQRRRFSLPTAIHLVLRRPALCVSPVKRTLRRLWRNTDTPQPPHGSASVKASRALSQHLLRLRPSRTARRRIAHYNITHPTPAPGLRDAAPGRGGCVLRARANRKTRARGKRASARFLVGSGPVRMPHTPSRLPDTRLFLLTPSCATGRSCPVPDQANHQRSIQRSPS